MRFEVHHTPKHGSWLNMAEIESSVLSGQCPDQRSADRQSLEQAVEVWRLERNERCVGVNWQFTTEDVRIKLNRLYPVIQP